MYHLQAIVDLTHLSLVHLEQQVLLYAHVIGRAQLEHGLDGRLHRPVRWAYIQGYGVVNRIEDAPMANYGLRIARLVSDISLHIYKTILQS